MTNIVPPTNPTSSGRGILYFFLAIFVGLPALFIVGCSVLVATSKPGNDYDNRQITATRVCHEAVEKQLKSPGSAKYSGEDWSQKGAVYTVTGSVDSQNSFGALIRSTYVCTATYRTGEMSATAQVF